MAISIKKWFVRGIPQNLIIQKPLLGTLILSIIWFGFVLLYKPFGVHGSRSLSFKTTMALYALTQGISIFGAARLLKWIPFFSKETEWTIVKEILAIILMLFTVGNALYFAGFIIEPPSVRWNIATYLDSCKLALLLGIIPFSFCTLINYRYLFFVEIEKHYVAGNFHPVKSQNEELVHISSQLKKEHLNFYPDQFIYCEADGNYVIFHLQINGQNVRQMIRNSINNIEQQLSRIPYIMRIHRAFIVNLRMVASKRGNTLGYLLKINNSDSEIPVSRNNTKDFDRRMKQLR